MGLKEIQWDFTGLCEISSVQAWDFTGWDVNGLKDFNRLPWEFTGFQWFRLVIIGFHNFKCFYLWLNFLEIGHITLAENN